MKNYKTYLFDADGTLLNYDKAELQALKETFRLYNLTYNQQIEKAFADICSLEWKRFGLSNTTDKEIQSQFHKLYYDYSKSRFCELVKHFHLSVSPTKFDISYRQYLAQQTDEVSLARDVCMKLSEFANLYVVTNGLSSIQKSRLIHFKPYLKGIIVSEDLNCCKPSKEFFEKAITIADIEDKSTVLMVGDSLTSDILGANRFGIDSCWFNPKRKKNDTQIIPKYELNSLILLVT